MRNTFYLTVGIICCLLHLGTSAQVITTVAGNSSGGFGGDGGAATSASLNTPNGVFSDNSGNIFIADELNNRIRKVNSTGIISSIAGTGAYGFSGDGGPATAAIIASPSDVITDTTGNVYFTDFSNSRIRKISTSGIISTIAGSSSSGYSGDGGPATAAQLHFPSNLLMDGGGNIYVSDNANNVIRKINTSGIITTVGGNGSAGFSGDGGPATAAQLNNPNGIAIDPGGNLYIADALNQRVRMVTAAGIIKTCAGIGSAGFSGDGGPATAAQLSTPAGVSVDNFGNLSISDCNTNRIRRVTASGTISTFAGTGTAGFSGDGGAATAARIRGPLRLSQDTARNLFVADQLNHRIRKITPCSLPSVAQITGADSICPGSTTTLADASTGGSWTSNDTSIAYVSSSSGIVTAVAAGPAIITYAISNSCGTAFATHTINILPLPYAGTITGPTSMCVGATITLSDSATGGTWSTSTTTTATINPSTGAVLGISLGTTTITYALTNSCGTTYTTRTIAVNDAPYTDTISGLDSICTGITTLMTDTTAGGTWSSSNAAIASINTSTGMVTGIGGGTATITYTVTNACGTASAYHTITVNDPPHLTSPVALSVCDSMLLIYTPTSDSAGAAFAWSRSLATGISNAAATGTGSVYEYLDNTTAAPVNAIYNYATSLHGCVTNQAVVVTVNPTPYGVTTGLDTICIGMTATLYNSFTGGTGTWSSSNVAIATVSGTGIYFGVSAGNCNIMYYMNLNGCLDTTTYPVTILPAGKCPDAVAMLPGTLSTSLALSPNPSNGSFTVTLNSPVSEEAAVTITNPLGQKVQEFQMHTNQPQEKQTRLLPGIYMLTATTKHDRFATKLVVEY